MENGRVEGTNRHLIIPSSSVVRMLFRCPPVSTDSVLVIHRYNG